MPFRHLKTWPEAFESIWDGRCSHTVRRADRPFSVGDTLVLLEWDPRRDPDHRATGRAVAARVTYIQPPDSFGLPGDLCVMSLADVRRL